MKKRRIFFAAAVCAAALLLGGCSEKTETQEESSWKDKEKIEITVAIWDAEDRFVGDEIQKTIEEKFNIKITPVNMKWSDYQQKVELWASTRSLPDLFAGNFRNSPLYAKWISQGILRALPDDLSEYPNLEQYLNAPEMRKSAEEEGKLYCIPRMTYPSQAWTAIDRIVAYRWDLAQEVGITKEPETWQEFETMMLKIMEADPEQTGIGGMTATGENLLSGCFLPYASPLAAEEGLNYKWIKDTDGMYRPVYFAEDMIPAFSLGRELYEKGVIEKDIMLNTDESSVNKFLQGKSAAILYSGGFGGIYGKMIVYWEQERGSEFTDSVKALHLMQDVNGNKTYPVWDYAWSESYINANVSDEKLERILALYDYLLSDEGSFYSIYGPEGVLYEKKDGKVKLFDSSKPLEETYPSALAFGILARWNPCTYDERFESGVPEIYSEVNQELKDEAEQVELPAYETKCTEIVREKQSEFSTHQSDDFIRIITGKEPVETMWEEILAEYQQDGLDQVIREVNQEMQKNQN